MKYIEKGKEPEELMEYKKQPGVNYRTMSKVKPIRDKVKKDLIEEQGYICCYCGGRVEFDEKTSIEHFLPKEIFPPLEENVEQQFYFYSDGSIEGVTDEAKEAIGKLHLDNKVLNARRKHAIDAYTSEEFDSYTQEQWADEIKWLEKRDKEGKFMPFCFAVKRYIEDNMM